MVKTKCFDSLLSLIFLINDILAEVTELNIDMWKFEKVALVISEYQIVVIEPVKSIWVCVAQLHKSWRILFPVPERTSMKEKSESLLRLVKLAFVWRGSYMESDKRGIVHQFLLIRIKHFLSLKNLSVFPILLIAIPI